MNRLTCLAVAAACGAASIPAPRTHAAILQGVYTFSSPDVWINWSSDFGQDPSQTMWPANSGPYTGFSEIFVQGSGPGLVSSYLSINCPAPQTTPGLPTVARSVLDNRNFSGLYGLFTGGGTGHSYIQLDASYPVVHYRIEWSYHYELLEALGSNGTGTITLVHGGFNSPVNVTLHNNGEYGSDPVSGVITGTTSGSAIRFGIAAELYQGGSAAGHGRLTTELRMWVDTQPIPPPPCPGDADASGAVNFADITAVLTNFNAIDPSGNGPGDADHNGTVNFADITSVLTNFGAPCPL